MTRKLKLTAGFDRSLALDGGGSYRYLVVDIEAPEEARDERTARTPLNLALVIDRSGSMNGEKIQCAKEAALGVVDSLRSDDRLAVVIFDNAVDTLVSNLSMNADGRESAKRAIEGIEARGMTDLAAGWLQGAEHAAETMATTPDAHHHVILLSDGMANQGITDVEALSVYARGLLERGIQTSTVGIGDDYSPEILQALAEHGGGRMHDAEHPAEIVEVVLAEFGDIRQVWASRVELAVLFPHGTSLDAFTGEPVAGESSNEKRFLLGSIIAGARRRLVFQVRTGRGRAGDRFEFDIRLAGERDGAELRSTTVASLECAPLDRVTCQPRDTAASELVASVWQSRLVREITRINAERDIEALDALIPGEFKYFQRYCSGLENGAEMVRNVNRLLQRARRPMNERSRKEIAYSAFRTMKGAEDRRSMSRGPWESYIDR